MFIPFIQFSINLSASFKCHIGHLQVEQPHWETPTDSGFFIIRLGVGSTEWNESWRQKTVAFWWQKLLATTVYDFPFFFVVEIVLPDNMDLPDFFLGCCIFFVVVDVVAVSAVLRMRDSRVTTFGSRLFLQVIYVIQISL